MSKNLRPLIVATAFIVGAIFALSNSANAVSPGVVAALGQQAPAAPVVNSYSTTVTCAPMALWNPDAGIGLVSCGPGYNNINLESESTTEVKFVWRYKNENGVTKTPVTRANLDTYGVRRKVGGNNGSSYQAEVSGAQNTLFCVTQADAGVLLVAECGR